MVTAQGNYLAFGNIFYGNSFFARDVKLNG